MYQLLNLRALKISMLYKNHIFQYMDKIFCVEFQRVPLKFHTKYLTYTLKDAQLSQQLWPDSSHVWAHNVMFNSLASGRCNSDFKSVICKYMFMSIPSQIDRRWMPQNNSDYNSALVQAMAWCHQATSHYLRQCWPRSIPSYGITKPGWNKVPVSNLDTK